MLLNDRKEFNKSLMMLFSAYGKQPDLQIYDIWWNIMEEFEMADVKKGFNQYVTNQKYPPVPAAVLEYLPRLKVMTAEEAWAHIPKTQYESAWVTSTMMQAFGVAEDLLVSGDKIGARIAFIKSYNNTQETGNWFYSQAYNVPFEEKKQRRISDYKLLEEKRCLPVSKEIDRLQIENTSESYQKNINEKGLKKLRLITNEMLNSSQKAISQE